MKLKETALYSILYQKCPHCHEGELWNSGAFNLKHYADMPERCSHCGQRYYLEPNFYSGAMYVSYGLQVALFATIYVTLKVLFDPPAEVYIVAIVVASALLFTLTYRFSRAIYLNFFVSYKKPETK
jgi:uncharacterized protein (DUF983 family)